MALLLKFDLTSMSAQVYDQLIVRLKAVGADMPPGLLYHVVFGSPDRLQVVDIWQSATKFQEFGATLAPTLRELQTELLEPDVSQVYNIIKGKRINVTAPTTRLARFDPPGLTIRQYDDVMRRLDEAGFGAPSERLYHVCYREGDALHIISVWQCEKELRTFFDQVLRIATDLGITLTPPEPVIEKVHHIIDGSRDDGR
jgi:hypothetical protein